MSPSAETHSSDTPEAEQIPEGRRKATLTSLGSTMRLRGMSPAAIEAALLAENTARCDPPLSDAEVRDVVASILAWTPGKGEPPWPAPEPLPDTLPPLPSMTAAMIPEPLREWVSDVAERAQVPLEYPAVGAIVALAAIVGRSLGIRPKREDDWPVVPNLWGGIVGPPGVLKTPALQEMLKPLQRLEEKARKTYEIEMQAFETERILRKVQRDITEKGIKDALKEGTSPETIKHRFHVISDETGKPSPRRYIVNDATVEKLGEILNQNRRGVLHYRDELSGFFASLERDGHEMDRAFYLEAWNGNGPYTYDRIGRGTLRIEAACVSILGNIGPNPLAKYLQAATKGGAGDDGLMQRFQLLVYPDILPNWVNIDREPDKDARNKVFGLFERLDKLDASGIGATIDADGGIPFLHFAEDAQDYFDAWRTDLEQRIRSGDDPPVMRAHLGKFRSLMPALALLFHVVELMSTGTSGPVTLKAAAMAAAWCDLLEAHARRIYHTITAPAITGAHSLAQKIQKGQLPSPFTARDVYRHNWSGLTTAEEVERAAEILEDALWIRAETIPAGHKGGRPSAQYRINPKARRKKEDAA